MDHLVERQVRNNDESRDQWERFAGHRACVTQVLIGAAPATDARPSPARIAILGAGNANDLELVDLTSTYAEVHLVDLDEQALASASVRQPDAAWNRITLHGGVDVSGVYDQLSRWSPEQKTPADEAERLIAAVAAAPRPKQLGAGFDVVASVGLITQLFAAALHSLGEWHDHYLELVQALRTRHLRMIAELTRPGGIAVLITDFVSSQTFPTLPTVPPEELPKVLTRLVAERNFFTGANPRVLQQFFQTDPVVAPRVAQLRVTLPWLWDLGPRVYAVFGIVARLKDEL